MLTAVIIDDEPKSREMLEEVIRRHCPALHILALANSANAAFEVVNELKPDLVFLDVEMPGGNGFDFLEKFTDIDFEIIFTTAYGHYAIKAIQYAALDYLLKPVGLEELKNAVERAQYKIDNKLTSGKQFELLLKNLKTTSTLKKIVISDAKGFIILEKEKITRCEARNNYTIFYMANGENHFSSKHLKEYETLFKDDSFVRVHNSHLINIHYIERYERGEGGTVYMSDNSEIEVSRRRKNELLEKIAGL